MPLILLSCPTKNYSRDSKHFLCTLTEAFHRLTAVTSTSTVQRIIAPPLFKALSPFPGLLNRCRSVLPYPPPGHCYIRDLMKGTDFCCCCCLLSCAKMTRWIVLRPFCCNRRGVKPSFIFLNWPRLRALNAIDEHSAAGKICQHS